MCIYKKAKKKAMQNGRQFHLAAILRRRGSVIKIGENTDKTHPRFKRRFNDGTCAAHMHAEMNVLRFARPGDELEVMRFRKGGKRALAKPCRHCMKHIIEAGIKKVTYTDENGEWVEMEL